MANNKFVLRDGTVLLDLTSDTVTANKVLQGYTAHDASGAAITGTYTGGGGGLDVFNNVGIGAINGVCPIINSVVNNIGALSCSEAQAIYEGINIILPNLTVNASYIVNFDFQYTDAAFAGTSYMSGVKIRDTNYSDFANWTDWTENIDRDLLKHNHQMQFTATAATMFLSFNVCGLSDSRVNYFEITNLYVEAAL